MQTQTGSVFRKNLPVLKEQFPHTKLKIHRYMDFYGPIEVFAYQLRLRH